MSKKIRLLAKLMRSGEFRRTAEAEKAVREGRVTVDGRPATDAQHSVKANATVSINDRPVEPAAFTYVILDKQKGMVCQKTDKEKSVYDVIASIKELDEKTRASLFCVGRLDRDTEGLLIITNDGQLEKLLTKGKRIIKIYAVVTDAPVSEGDAAALLKGVQVTDDDTGMTFHVKAIAIKRLGERTIELGIDEGRKRQIKKMLEALGNRVVSLRRVGIGKMRIDSLNFDGRRYLISRKQDLKF